MNLHRSLLTLLFSLLFLSSNAVWAQSTKRDDLIREIESLRSQLKVREDALLEPSTEDRESFAEFLGQKDTGLIRLLPREEYDYKKKLTISGGGAYYSFSRLTHEYGYGSDIGLERGNLRVGFGGADYGMMANLGDIRVLMMHGQQIPLADEVMQELLNGLGIINFFVCTQKIKDTS